MFSLDTKFIYHTLSDYVYFCQYEVNINRKSHYDVLRTYGTLTSYIYILHDEICDKCKHISFCISHHVLATSRLKAMILHGLYNEDVYELTRFFQYSSQRTMERWEVLKYDLFPLIFKQRWIVDIGNRDIPRQ